MTNPVRDIDPAQSPTDLRTFPFPPSVDDSLLTRWQRIRTLRRDMFCYVVETPDQYDGDEDRAGDDHAALSSGSCH